MFVKKYPRILFLVGIFVLVSTACALPAFAGQQNQPPTPDNSETQVARTVEAMMTEIAGQSITSTPQVVYTVAPSSTPQPTATTVILPSATATSLPSATPTTVCDQAGFVDDISIPDGAVITAGAQFVKTWRLKNTGACTWSPDYTIFFDKGAQMEGPSSQKLGASVAPGQTIDISVTLRAPAQPGSYRGYWLMRNVSGTVFGLGLTAERFYVDIKSQPATSNINGYDFAANFCIAEWTANNKTLPCTGKDGSEDGFVLYRANPVLESGYIDDEPGLVTNPPKINDGVIRGKYSSYTVRSGDTFKSLISCENNAKNCSVRFQLDYQIDNGAIQTLGAWNESYEGFYTTVSVDLSSLAGKNVRFILTVLSNGASDNDRALWLAPRIVKVDPTATPTMTPTVTLTPNP